MTSQKRNGEQVELLSADFQGRYEPQFALSSLFSTFQMLAGLRGFWPMSSSNEAGAAIDFSGQGRLLTRNGTNFVYGTIGIVPALGISTNSFLSRADEAGLDITGAGGYAAPQGLTLGGWFQPAAVAATSGLITKHDGSTAAGSAYGLFFVAGGASGFQVISGANTYNVNGATLASGGWYFLVGRYLPSTSVDLWVNGVKYTNITGIPAYINNVAAPFNIGAYNSTAAFYNGNAAACFISSVALPEVIIKNLFQQSRAAFGV